MSPGESQRRLERLTQLETRFRESREKLLWMNPSAPLPGKPQGKAKSKPKASPTTRQNGYGSTAVRTKAETSPPVTAIEASPERIRQPPQVQALPSSVAAGTSSVVLANYIRHLLRNRDENTPQNNAAPTSFVANGGNTNYTSIWNLLLGQSNASQANQTLVGQQHDLQRLAVNMGNNTGVPASLAQVLTRPPPAIGFVAPPAAPQSDLAARLLALLVGLGPTAAPALTNAAVSSGSRRRLDPSGRRQELPLKRPKYY